jgi:hypothetical protein
MLTQLSTVKVRLGIEEFEVKYDGILTNAIRAVSARFDKECNRTLARSVDAVEEFDGEDREIMVACFPIESVNKFELKRAVSWRDGWSKREWSICCGGVA